MTGRLGGVPLEGAPGAHGGASGSSSPPPGTTASAHSVSRRRSEGAFYPANQAAKQGPILRLLDAALGRAAAGGPDAPVLELFCADGFYGLRAALCGARRVVGVDTDEREVAKARLAAKLLGVCATTRVRRGRPVRHRRRGRCRHLRRWPLCTPA